MDDLVTRLRARTGKRWESWAQDVMEYEDPLCKEAATALAASAERVEALTKALSRLLKAAKTVQGYGARPGTQWTDLSFGIVCAVAALDAAPRSDGEKP